MLRSSIRRAVERETWAVVAILSIILPRFVFGLPAPGLRPPLFFRGPPHPLVAILLIYTNW